MSADIYRFAMNPYDVAVAFILAYCLIRGVFRGLIKELASLVAVLAGFYIANRFYPLMAEYIVYWFGKSAYTDVISAFILFTAVFLLISMLGVVIRYLMQVAFLGWLDRITGAIFGCLKAVLIAAVLMVFLTALLPKNSRLIQESALAPHVTAISGTMAQVVSPELKQAYKKKIAELKRRWKQAG